MKGREEWLAFEWPNVYFYQVIVPAEAWMFDFAKYSRGLTKMATMQARGTSCIYVIRAEYEKAGEEFFRRVMRSPQIMFVILKKVHQAAEHIFALGKKWNQDDFSKLSDKELLARHQILFKWDDQLWKQGQIQNLLELHNNYLTRHIKEVLARQFPKADNMALFTALTTPHYQSMPEQQDKAFLSLLKKSNSAAVRGHWQKYTWMTYGWGGPALSYEYFLETFKAARRQLSIVKSIKTKQKNREKFLRQQSQLLSQLPPSERRLARLLRSLLESKLERVDAHSQTYFLADKINSQIAKRLGFSVNQVRMIMPRDISKLFKKASPDALNREYDYVLYWFEKGKNIKKLVGAVGRKQFAYVAKRLPKVAQVDSLEGELAFPGKVRGKVRLILDIKDAAKFKPGEILVTRITDPSFVAIMKKAKAIVTDIGGITSHAAIVSRELQKPCIVGTQFATKIFKDGDRVEVDAVKGLVRKL